MIQIFGKEAELFESYMTGYFLCHQSSELVHGHTIHQALGCCSMRIKVLKTTPSLGILYYDQGHSCVGAFTEDGNEWTSKFSYADLAV